MSNLGISCQLHTQNTPKKGQHGINLIKKLLFLRSSFLIVVLVILAWFGLFPVVALFQTHFPLGDYGVRSHLQYHIQHCLSKILMTYQNKLNYFFLVIPVAYRNICSSYVSFFFNNFSSSFAFVLFGGHALYLWGRGLLLALFQGSQQEGLRTICSARD